uniref:Reverse transcriptase domain-containing protein n=1 Tax=Amphimedon queenslandica TaxID=400682 RepID=A0A1X7TVW8_AMPQE
MRAAFVSLVMNGETPAEIRHLFFGARLTAISKEGGGVCPIAVGCTLRHSVAKITSGSVIGEISAFLAPRQLGYGVKGGAESAVHASRWYLKSLHPSQDNLKLDFQNAFNSICRDRMLHSNYPLPSTLLFIHATQPHLPFSGREGFLNVGLSLNSRKSEVICENREVHDHLLPSLPNSLYIDPSNATLLGSPLGDVACVSAALRAKVASLSVMGERLRSFSAHDSILLLRYSFAIPKLLYLLQTAPCFLSSTIREYDSSLCSIVSGISNASLSVSDHIWLQASLPVRSGGLGFRCVVQLAPSAFLASAAVSFPVFCAILGAFKAPLIPFQEVALEKWSTTLVDVFPPSGDNAKLQRAWDFPHVAATFTSLCDGAPDPASRDCLMAVSSPHSGLWLNALPLSSLGLRMDDCTIRIAVGLHLGLPLCHPHSCSHCGGHVNMFATHGLSCRRSEGVPFRLEPSGLNRCDGKRPDGVTMVPWSSGKSLVWDATCPDTLDPSYERVAVCSRGAVAQASEKCAKYKSLDCSYSFTPVAIETLGAIGPKSLSFLKKLGSRIREQTGEVSSFSYLLQRLSVAVQRANAISVMGTLPKLSYPDTFFLS